MQIVTRKAKLEDAQAILDYLNTISTQSDNLSFGEEGIGYTLEEEIAMIEKINQSENQVMFLALDQDKIVSVANLSASSRERMKHHATLGISVLKDYWHLGIGTQMMKLIHEFAQKSSILEIIRLDVRSDNINAIHLYQKFGYEKIGCFAEEMKINGHYVSIDQMRVLLKKEN